MLLMLGNSVVYAQRTGVSGKFGTLGLGIELIQSLKENVNVRFGVNFYNGNYDGTKDNMDYDIDLDLRSGSLIVDWHPYEGEFRVSGGVLYNGNTVEVLGNPTSRLTIGDIKYTPSQIGELTYDADFRKIAPYLGIGVGNAVENDRKLGFVFEFGVVFQGSPEIDLSANGWSASDQTFQEELQKEEEELEDDLHGIKYYPVISFGFTYRFW
jgi:hypothetical protein